MPLGDIDHGQDELKAGLTRNFYLEISGVTGNDIKQGQDRPAAFVPIADLVRGPTSDRQT